MHVPFCLPFCSLHDAAQSEYEFNEHQPEANGNFTLLTSQIVMCYINVNETQETELLLQGPAY